MKNKYWIFLLLFILPACFKVDNFRRPENIYSNILTKYRKELLIIESELEYDELKKEIVDTILVKMQDLEYPMLEYRNRLANDYKRIKNLLKRISIDEDEELYQEIDCLKNQLKLILKIIVTGDRFWEEKKIKQKLEQSEKQISKPKSEQKINEAHDVN